MVTDGLYIWFFFELVIAFLFAWAVWRASTGFGGIGGKVLECGVLVYLGKISYGIYVYHLFIPQLVIFLLSPFGLEIPNTDPGAITLSIIATVLLAFLFWHLMEAPINNLKRRFQYVPSAKRQGKC